MTRFHSIARAIWWVACASVLPTCCGSGSTIIVPEVGYHWPATQRDYWPTNGWKTAALEAHGIDPAKIDAADRFARNDPLARALLVVKDGYIVHERYYGNGGVEKSTNLWSVTKSFVSALVGMVQDQGLIRSTEQRMAELMPAYPAFGSITLQQVLTQTTGLAWEEGGRPWNQWVFSPDWVEAALARGQIRAPGERFFYSSANSQFLAALVRHLAGETPGRLAKRRLFDPLGIPFEPLSEPITYRTWKEYLLPLPQSWRQDPQGTEIAGFGLYLTARDMAKFGFLYLNRGRWDGRQIVSSDWVERSTRDQVTDVYGRYSHGYQWWITRLAGLPGFLASGWGGQIIGVVPSLDLVVVIKYDAEQPEHPKSGSRHDDMHLFELVVKAVK